jgi:hypothetical protein
MMIDIGADRGWTSVIIGAIVRSTRCIVHSFTDERYTQVNPSVVRVRGPLAR